MQVRTPSIGEVEEVGKQAVEAGQTFLATGTLEDLDKSIAASKAFTEAVGAKFPSKREQAWEGLQNLIASTMDLEEKEALDEYYANQPLPCEVDEVDADPWVEDEEAVAAAIQADAQAFEIESRS